MFSVRQFWLYRQQVSRRQWLVGGSGLLLIGAAVFLLIGYLVSDQSAPVKTHVQAGRKSPTPPATISATPSPSHTDHSSMAQPTAVPPLSIPHQRPTIVKNYYTPVIGIDWAKVQYRPRQFVSGLKVNDPTRGSLTVQNVGNYTNWDFFTGYDYSVHRLAKVAGYWQFGLNRGATLGVVWRSQRPVPNWLSAWQPGNTVTVAGQFGGTWRVYTKFFGPGVAALGGVYDPQDNPQGNQDTIDTYWVLFSESNGQPSAAPTTPAGLSAPQSNQACPAWVHDQYKAKGPDGKYYPTWHAQIDPVYWCYFGHEHGSDPAYFDSRYHPLYGYSGSHHGHDEAHAGFKNVLWGDDRYLYYLTHHFGTASLHRACMQFHTFDLAIKRLSDNKIIVDVHMMGDFGDSRINRSQEILTPPECPDQGKIALGSGSHGVRQLPAVSADSIGYEPWRVDYSRNVLGFVGGITINNPDPIVICNNARCDTAVPTGNTGTTRFTTDDRFGVVSGPNTGVFYTEPMARTLSAPAAHMSVRQYVEPGLNFKMNIPMHCRDVYAFGRRFVCDKSLQGASPAMREGAIHPPN
jgi:hypothetical protein